MKLKVRKESVIDVSDWDKLVVETYGNHTVFNNKMGVKNDNMFP